MIGFIADLHFHNYTSFSKPLVKGLNTRCETQLTLFLKIVEGMKEKGVKTIIIAGDIFHKRNLISVPVFNEVQYVLKYCIRHYGVDIILLSGNHDMTTTANNVSSLNIIGSYKHGSNYLRVVRHDMMLIDDCYVTCLGWKETKIINKSAKIKGVPHILVTHADIYGAETATGFKMEIGNTAKKIRGGYDYAVIGHIHKPQLLDKGKVLVPGSPWALNRGEKGEHFYWIFDNDDKKKWNGFLVNHPKFYHLTFDEAIGDGTTEDDYNYITVEVPKHTSKGDIIILNKKFPNSEFVLKGNAIPEKRRGKTKIKLKDGVNVTIERFVKETKTKLDKSKLLQYGKSIVEGIK